MQIQSRAHLFIAVAVILMVLAGLGVWVASSVVEVKPTIITQHVCAPSDSVSPPLPAPSAPDQSIPVDPPARPRPGEISMLFDSLKAAAEQQNVSGANLIRQRIASRWCAEAVACTTILLLEVRGWPEVGHGRDILLSNLLYLVCLDDPLLALEWLRMRWTEPRLTTEGRYKRWADFDKRPTSWIASQALERFEQIEAAELGVMLSYSVKKEEQAAQNLATALLRLYGKSVPEGERPDPWLSALLNGLFANNFPLETAEAESVRQLLTAMRGNRALSARLREQISVYLAGTPQSLLALIEMIGAAASVSEAAKSLRAYMFSHVLTVSDAELLLAAIQLKFGATPDGPASLLETVIEGSYDPIPIANIHTLTGKALASLNDPDLSAEQQLAALEVLEGIRRSWKTVEGRMGGASAAMFDLTHFRDAKAALLRAWGNLKVNGSGIYLDLARSRIMGLVWNTPISLQEKIDTASELLLTLKQCGLPMILAVTNGMYRNLAEIKTAHGTGICSVLNKAFSLNTEAVTSPRPIRPGSTVFLTSSKLATVLQACSFPPIPDGLRVTLGSLVAIVREDMIDTSQGDRVQSQISRDLTVVLEMAKHYDLK